MKRMTVADFSQAVEDGKAASLLKKPLIVEDGVGPSAKIKIRGASPRRLVDGVMGLIST
jgi:hypothetical protein